MIQSAARLPSYRYGFSQMVFRTDLRNTHGIEIPLASFVDLTIDEKAVFGCVTKKELSQEELGALPKSWHKELEQPPRYLFTVFLEACNAHDGPDARLRFLSEKYHGSLYARPAIWLPRPERLQGPINDSDVRFVAEQIVLTKLYEEERVFLAPQPAIANLAAAA